MTKFNNSFSEEVFNITYQYKNESLDDMFRRVAKATASVEKDPEFWEEKFYEILSDFQVVPGGRILSNAGTEIGGTTLINCFVDGFMGEDKDSMNGIMDAIKRQAFILKSEGGYGFNVSTLRPRSSYVEGIKNLSPGAVRMLDMWNTVSEVITAGGDGVSDKEGAKKKIRKGAQMCVMSVWHPDIEQFITAKQASGQLTKFNMSVGVTDEFMNAVINHKKWDLEFPEYENTSDIYEKGETIKRADNLVEFEEIKLTIKDIYKRDWNGNLKKWKEKGLPTKIYKTFEDANELWDLIMQSTYNRNEPGVLFLDTINKFNNLYYCEYIDATNPCLSGSTMLKGPHVSLSLKQLYEDWKHGITMPILVHDFDKDEDIYVIPDDVILTKHKANTTKLILDNTPTGLNHPHELIGTTDHKVFIIHGEDYAELEYDNPLGYVEIKDIEKKDILKCSIGSYPKVNDIIENYSEEDVYDIKIAGYNNFYANGYLVHNCGEVPIPNGSSCLLTAINLTQFVKDNNWDYEKLQKFIPVIIRFMDNINEIANVPLPHQKEEMLNKRRLGLGRMGYASALLMMKKRYGSVEALKLTEDLEKFICNTAYKASANLAKEKGVFPLYDKEKFLKSYYIQSALDEKTIKYIAENGMRNSHLFALAPTGNTAVFSNNVSGGIEPIISMEYTRYFITPIIPEGLNLPTNIDWKNKTYKSESNWKWIKEGNDDLLFIEFENNKYKFDSNRGFTKEANVKDYGYYYLVENNLLDENADYLADLNSLTIKEHIDTLKVISRYVDQSISKTINLPNDYPYEDFKDLYMNLYKSGTIKGGTSYRWGTMMSVISQKIDERGHDVLVKTHAPKRPRKLKCDIHHLTARGQNWVVLIGLMNGGDNPVTPYEVFAFKKKNINISAKVTEGSLIKIKSGHYNLELAGIELEDVTKLFQQDEEEALTRMISIALRHGVDISFIVEQLNKSEGNIASFSKAISRTLKKYIPDNLEVGEKCPECGSDLIYIEACIKCSKCTYSKC